MRGFGKWLSLVIICSIFTHMACARSFDDIKKEGTIIVATEGQFPPFNFFQGSQLTGFEIELTQALVAKMGLKLQWKVLGFDALLAGLRQDRWDMVIASHGVTEERTKAVTFADPHYCSGGIIVAKDTAIKAAKDLTGKTISAQSGTTYLQNVQKVAGVKEVKNFPKDSDARSALETGRVDVWVTDRFVAKRALASAPNSSLHLGEFLFVERIAAAFAKGNQSLAAEFNKTLAAFMADGGYAALSQKWFKEDVRCQPSL
jgi:polar amino acid transport system substrate-binding protein